MKKKTKYFRKCFECNELIYYTNKYNLKRAIKNKSLCSICYHKLIVANRRSYIRENNPFYGKKHDKKSLKIMIIAHLGKLLSKEQKKKIGLANKGLKHDPMSLEQRKKISKNKMGQEPWNKNKKMSKEYCKIMSKYHKIIIENCIRGGKKGGRISIIRRIEKENGQICPNYNRKACSFFDQLNKNYNLNGMHALNKKELHIKKLGYFVDYYEPNLNLIIEWDEEYLHYDINGNLKLKDIQREKEIKEHLKCYFLRIKENNITSQFYNKLEEIISKGAEV